MTPGGELQKGVRFCYGGAACQLQEEERFWLQGGGAFQGDIFFRERREKRWLHLEGAAEILKKGGRRIFLTGIFWSK